MTHRISSHHLVEHNRGEVDEKKEIRNCSLISNSCANEQENRLSICSLAFVMRSENHRNRISNNRSKKHYSPTIRRQIVRRSHLLSVCKPCAVHSSFVNNALSLSLSRELKKKKRIIAAKRAGTLQPLFTVLSPYHLIIHYTHDVVLTVVSNRIISAHR